MASPPFDYTFPRSAKNLPDVDESLPGHSRTPLGVFVALIFLDIRFHPVAPGKGIGAEAACGVVFLRVQNLLMLWMT